MDGSTQGSQAQEKGSAGQDEGKRERSSIAFPYLTLDEAVEVATAIHQNVGTGDCSDDQLAPWLEVSQKSSGYRLRMAAARLFGVVESPSAGAYRLTQLGRQIVDSSQTDKARADAFLNVPLFQAVFDRYRGNTLPPLPALEREFVSLGVAQKQTGRARSSFERSAQSAGYFQQGADRLVRPGIAGPEATQGPPPDQITQNGSGGGSGRHPFINGLLKTLPEPETTWTIEGRAAWLRAAANCFNLMYKGDGSITIQVESKERSGLAGVDAA